MTHENFTPPEVNNNPKHDGRENEQKYNPPQNGIVASFNAECKKKCGIEFTIENQDLLADILSKEKNPDRIYEDITDIIDSNDNVNDTLKEYLEQISYEQNASSNEQTKAGVKENNINIEATIDDLISNANQLKNSVSNLDLTGKDKKYVEILSKIQNLEFDKNGTPEKDTELKEKIDLILTDLKNNPETLTTIALDLQAQSPKAYDNFRLSLIALDYDFQSILPTAETKAKLTLGTDTLQNATVRGNSIKQTDKDGFTTTAKLSDNTRHISKVGSKYAVVSDIDTKTAHEEAEKIAQNLRLSLKPLHDELTLIKAMKTALQGKGEPRPKIDEMKADLKALSPILYAELGLDFADSPEALLTLLGTREATTKGKIAELEKKADRQRADLITAMKLKAQEKDAIKKDMLNLFSFTGFDLLLKEETDIIFEHLNNNPHIVKTIGANAPFDIDNGVLGYKHFLGSNEKLSFESIKVFAKCFNKILTGDTKFPIGFDVMGNIVFYETKEQAKSKKFSTSLDMQFFLNQNLGGSNRIAKMIENLKKKEE